MPGLRRRRGRNVARAIATADSLAAAGDPLGAIEVVTDVNRGARDPRLERRLVQLRHEAFAELAGASGSYIDPGNSANGVRVEGGLPAIDAERLSAETVRAAILGYGSVLVRRLIDEGAVARLVEGIDRAFAARDAASSRAGSAATKGWFVPFKPSPGYGLGGGRRWNTDSGALWAADSPPVMFDLLEAFEEAGLPRLIADYLGERPALSMNKSVLRRVSPARVGAADWHQDGAFLGDDIRSLNVWVSLSHCGTDAPGLDIVPRRLEDIVETGTEGANFGWSVSPAVVEKLLRGQAPARPVFEPGDAILFDHFNLHRTATEPGMSENRYAIETWCFAPSTYPDGQVPLVL